MIELIERNGYIFQIDRENPTFRFKGDSAKIPPPPAPAPIPVIANEVEDFAMKEERNKSGFRKTFLTGNLTPKSTGKKTTLG